MTIPTKAHQQLIDDLVSVQILSGYRRARRGSTLGILVLDDDADRIVLRLFRGKSRAAVQREFDWARDALNPAEGRVYIVDLMEGD